MIYETLHETVLTRTLANGLRVYSLPRKEYCKSFAMLATDFGSVDASFTLGGVRYDTPVGVAHFLEHKMFEDVDGNALQKFSVTGADPNAFTSQTMTAYHFSCTERFTENLEILMKFVFTPYFTDENVEKEKGIIGQEIGMMEDTPGWQAYVGLFRALFREHPVRESIAGSVESISHITKETLFICHKAFYSPKNMVLVVCGDQNFEEICAIAEKFSPRQGAEIAARHYGTRSDTVAENEVKRNMQVSRPQFLLGFKDAPVAAGESHLRRRLLGDLALRILCGETAPLYGELYAERLIDSQFETEYSLIPEGAVALMGGESRDANAARGKLEAEVKRLAENGVSQERFVRSKKAAYGMSLRALGDADSYCHRQVEAAFRGENYADFAALYDAITAEDVQQMYARWARPNRSALSVILPLQE